MNPNMIQQVLMNNIQQAAQNPQMMVQQILQNNPAFAQAIRGQDVQAIAQNMMRQNGMDPQSIMQFLGGAQRR